MKTNQTQPLTLAAVAKTLALALNSLFFTDNNREFMLLKNFITS
jgi:hypothetical protein